MSMEINNTNSGVTSQIMDLKTSTPGVTRKEEIKTGFKNTNDYSKYLQEKYSYMNTGKTSMQGVPVTVSVSGAFLKKCMDNPEKAAYLEENLAAIPECIKRSVEYTKTMPGSPVMTYCNVSFDENGNITMTSGCTNDPDGKIARENAQRKAQEKKAAEEKVAKRRAEKKEAEEKLAEKRAEKAAESAGKFELTFTGSSVESITRLICINDNYDSNEPNADSASLLLPIKMIMNDNYAKDYSKKIRSSINAKMGNGEFLPSAGSIPYGYIRNAEKVTFDIDEETAPVVRRIFEMRAAGMSFNEMAKVLNAEEIPSPGNIRYLRGITKNEKYAKSNWIRGTIRKITNDLVYTGCRIHGRVKRDRLDQNKTRRGQDEWQIIENAHNAIISMELFEQVKAVNEQEIKKRETFTKREEVEDDMRDVLRDKVFCGDCGSRMSGRKGLGRKTSNNPAFIFFDCNQYHDTGKMQCSSHYIRQEDIMSAISRCLYGHFKAALDFESLLEEVKRKPKVVSYQRQNLDLVASLRAKATHLEAKKERMIIDLAEGTLDKTEYEFIHNRLANQISQIQVELEEAQRATKELENIEKSAIEWIDMLKNQWYLKDGDIDKKLMDLLINKIIVYDKNTIKVEVNFSDPFAPLQEYIKNVEEVLADAV